MLQPLYGGALARPFTDPPQRARPRLLPAHRRRAVPEAPDRRRAGAGVRDRQGLPQRGLLATSTTPSSRCSSGTRPTRTTRTSRRGWRSSSAYVATEVGYDGEVDFSPPWRRVTPARRDQGEDRDRHLELRERDALVAAAHERGIELDPTETWPELVDDLLSKHVEPDLVQPDVHHRLPGGAVAVREGHRSEPGLVERFECFALGWSSQTRSPS